MKVGDVFELDLGKIGSSLLEIIEVRDKDLILKYVDSGTKIDLSKKAFFALGGKK